MELNIVNITDSSCTESPSVLLNNVSTNVDEKKSSSQQRGADSGYHSWSNIEHSADLCNVSSSNSVDVVMNMHSLDGEKGEHNLPKSHSLHNSSYIHEPYRGLIPRRTVNNTSPVVDNMRRENQFQDNAQSKQGLFKSGMNGNHIDNFPPNLLEARSIKLAQPSCNNSYPGCGTGKNKVIGSPCKNCQLVNTTPQPKSTSCIQIQDVGRSSDKTKSDAEDLAIKIEFCLMFGYTANQIRAAVTKLSYKASKNDILAELSNFTSAQSVQNPSPSSKLEYHNMDGIQYETTGKELGELIGKGIDAPLEPALRARGPLAVDDVDKDMDKKNEDDSLNLRPIVIDGSNVAMSHGNKQYFSCKGILLTVDYFRSRNHRDITVFVPTYRKESPRPDAPIKDREILSMLEEERILVYTPSRCISGRRVTCYDDRFILRLAQETDGIIVSNDNFRDLQNEKPEWKDLIEKRLLMYSFVSDRFMPPDDPLGRNGPSIDNFLRKRPASEEQSRPQCPYGKKCTYGKKCKYFHPECARSVTDSIKEKSEKRFSASSMAKDLATELCADESKVTRNDMRLTPGLPATSQSAMNDAELKHDMDQCYSGMDTRHARQIHSCPVNNVPEPSLSYPGRNIYGDNVQSPYHKGDARIIPTTTPHDFAINPAQYPACTKSCENITENMKHMNIANKCRPPSDVCGRHPHSDANCHQCYEAHMIHPHPRMGGVPQPYNMYHDAGPPEFHANGSCVIENHNMQQPGVRPYQHSSPATFQPYDGGAGAPVVVQSPHLNLQAQYQRLPAHATYGIPRLYYPNSQNEQHYPNPHPAIPQPLVYPYGIPGTSQRIPPNIMPSSFYVPSFNQGSSSDNLLSHSYPFVAAVERSVGPPSRHDHMSSPNVCSDPKTYPPRATRRVYSSPNQQQLQHDNRQQQMHHRSGNPQAVTDIQPKLQSHDSSCSLTSSKHPKHNLFQNLCGLFERRTVEKVMNSNPTVSEPKIIIAMCLKHSQ